MIQNFTGGKIVAGQLYRDTMGNVWQALKNITNASAQPRKGIYWELKEAATAPSIINLTAEELMVIRAFITPLIKDDLGPYLGTYTVVQTKNKTYRAIPRKYTSLPAFESLSLHQVLQSASNSLTPKGSQGSAGGQIDIVDVVGDLWDEWSISGWEDNWPTSKIIIKGHGRVLLKQWQEGKNALSVKNRLAFFMENVDFEVGYDSLSGFLAGKNGENYELSINKGILRDIYVSSFSKYAPAIYLQNFFGIHASNIETYNYQHTGIHLENDSLTTNYGNSQFDLIRVQAPMMNEHSGLLISSVNGKPMNLNHFSYVLTGAIGGEWGQKEGVGIRIHGGATNTFSKIDTEYVPYPIRIEGEEGDWQKNLPVSFGNDFLSGYINVASGGTGIDCDQATGGNHFHNLMIDLMDSNCMIINDRQLYRPENDYDKLWIGSWGDMSKFTIASGERTFVQARKNGTLEEFKNGAR